MLSEDPYFIAFEDSIDPAIIPDHFTMFTGGEPHPLCQKAASHLQEHLQQQTEWSHNFGLDKNLSGAIIGKMFGVLIVRNKTGQLGYLAAFSGKMAGSNHHPGFVPPVFDGLTNNSFLNLGMSRLTEIGNEIKRLQSLHSDNKSDKINSLKVSRKELSISLQHELFDNYHFLNRAGEKKSLYEIFKAASYKNPPAGAGECAGPKLLQYAFQHQMTPLALTEFWWGQSPKSAQWKHGNFYPCCKEKCEPILAHMLSGINL